MRNEKREGASGRSRQCLSPGAGCSKLSERSRGPHRGCRRSAGAAEGPQQGTRGQRGQPSLLHPAHGKGRFPVKALHFCCLGDLGLGAPRGLGAHRAASPRYQRRLFPVTPPRPAGAPHPRERLRDVSKAGQHPKVTASIFWVPPGGPSREGAMCALTAAGTSEFCSGFYAAASPVPLQHLVGQENGAVHPN